jgi:hypothetical protein
MSLLMTNTLAYLDTGLIKDIYNFVVGANGDLPFGRFGRNCPKSNGSPYELYRPNSKPNNQDNYILTTDFNYAFLNSKSMFIIGSLVLNFWSLAFQCLSI